MQFLISSIYFFPISYKDVIIYGLLSTVYIVYVLSSVKVNTYVYKENKSIAK